VTREDAPDPISLVRDGYEQIADDYLAAVIAGGAPVRLQWLARLLARIPTPGSVLDLGCGAGVPVAATLAERGWRVTGIDVSPRQIELARTHVPTGEFLVVDATEAEFAAASFDAVVAYFSLTHIPRAAHAELLARVARWLVPGGWLLACLGTSDVDGWIEENFLGLGHTNWTNSFDVATNERLLMTAGFELDVADVVTTHESWGTEAWLWVLARTALSANVRRSTVPLPD
jgi:ubiquinone/menaquinone biosynthesis C-methylase UbiE